MEKYTTDFLSLHHCDCMDLMKQYPDKYFDICITDPPYGKKPTRDNKGTGGFNAAKNYDNKADIWDIRPTKEYFNELFRISKNQIIWGANYFIEDLKSSNCWICWDKKNGDNVFADFELAYTSFNSRARIHRLLTDKLNRFHPTQKPIELYDFCILNFAKQGDKIFDTHFGSGSIALAVNKANQLDKMNLHLTACEIDEEYVNKAIERIRFSIKQTTLNF